MKILRIIAAVCTAAAVAAAISGCGGKKDGGKEESNVKKVVMESSNVKTLGRTYLKDETLWLALSGTGVDFSYTGKDLKITVQGDEASRLEGNKRGGIC